MQLSSFIPLLALVSATIAATLPTISNQLLRRDEKCDTCTDCTTFDDNDTCVATLGWNIASTPSSNIYGDRKKVQVQFDQGSNVDGTNAYASMSIFSDEPSEYGYNVEVTFKRAVYDDVTFEVIKTNLYPFYYTIKGPKSCKMDVPGDFMSGEVATIKSQIR